MAHKNHWDDCMDLEAYMRSNTAHGIHKLNEKVLMAVMSEKLSDVS